MKEYRILECEQAEFSEQKPYEKRTKTYGGDVIITEKSVDGTSVFSIFSKQNLYFNHELAQTLCEETAKKLSLVLRNCGYRKGHKVLAIGLGNEGLVADSLGSRTAEKLLVTAYMQKKDRRDLGELCCFSPSVGGVTGIDSTEHIVGLVKQIKPSLLILIDTLSTSDTTKLAKVIQIKGDGIVPGGGVGKQGTKLDKEFLGIPVVSIGVPLVIYLRHIVAAYAQEIKSDKNIFDNDLIVTPKEIDLSILEYSQILAKAINKAVHKI